LYSFTHGTLGLGRKHIRAQQGPNPIEAYQGAVQQINKVMTAVAANQLESSTPCADWNVQSVINHALAVQKFANGVLSGSEVDGSIMSNVSHPIPSEGASAALKEITDTTLATLKTIDMTAVVQTPFGEMPGGQFIMVPIADMIIHTWDLAKSTGQDTTLDAGLAELGFNVMVNVAEGGRKMGAFGAEVSVPESASFQDRMLGLSGRQP